MKLNRYTKIFSNKITIFIVGLLFLLINALCVNGQSSPSIQSQLVFGSFINNVPVGSTSDLVMASDASGTVTPGPGLIEVSSAPQSAACIRIYFTKNDGHHAVTISFDPPVNIKNGIYTLKYTPPTNFKQTNNNWSKQQSSYWDVYIGGTLTIGSPSANPAGSYSGAFKVYYTYNNF